MMRSLWTAASGMISQQTNVDTISNNIANANTIIIEQADRFGLSQLYQIRGRVGRREKIAYCYLMINPDKELNEMLGY